MKIKTIGELKEYIRDLPNGMEVEQQGDHMYIELAKGVFYF